MSYPKVSIIMATYNRSATIKRAIDSMLAQTLRDFEFIIVDDGSSDETPQVLSECAAADARIRLLRQENKGLAAARNAGADKARGKYLAFMDDDDISLPLRLERQVGFLRNNPDYAACHCDYSNVMPTDEISKYDITAKPSLHDIKNTDEIKFRVFPRPLVTNYSIQRPLDATTVILKKSFVQCGGYRTCNTVIEDLDFTFLFLEKFKSAFINEIHYLYTRPAGNLGDNLSTKDPEKFIKMHIATYISAWHRLTNQEDPISTNKSLAEINQLVYKLPRRIRYIIYNSLLYMWPALKKAHKYSGEEVKKYFIIASGITPIMSAYYEILLIIKKPFAFIRKVLIYLWLRLKLIVKLAKSYL